MLAQKVTVFAFHRIVSEGRQKFRRHQHAQRLLAMLPLMGALLAHSSTWAQVLAWGFQNDGACNVPSTLASVSQVDVGQHAIALRQDGTVACWGYNAYGQCNVPTTATGIVQVSAGEFHSVALKSNGSVVCWGWNQYGQANTPSGLTTVVQVSAGFLHNIALKADGSVKCWGYNGAGESTPPFGLLGVKQVTGGNYHTGALKTDGSCVLWGMNNFTQCTLPADVGQIKQLDCGGVHTAALTSTGSVRCWGDNSYGQCNIPANLGTVSRISTGRLHTAAIKTDGSVICWGYDQYRCCSGAPAGLTGVASIACGTDLTIALLAPPIVINNVKPISGPASGGTTVTINGTNFSPTARVTFDGVAATSVVVLSSTEIRAVTPAGFPGESTVSVDYGSATAFYYRPECGSDLDQDGEVTAADIAIVLLDFGPCYQSPLTAPATEVPPLLDPQALPDAPRHR